MSESNNQRKRDLECLRLAADCRQLASDVQNADLRLGFLRMSEVWTSLAEQEGPNTETSINLDGFT
jgi:hypothetical protein